jgi:hypothetical protein
LPRTWSAFQLDVQRANNGCSSSNFRIASFHSFGWNER